jgi:hypothetical protein
MESVYETVSTGNMIPSFRCSNVVSVLKNEKYLRKSQNISTLEDEGNALFETLGSGYPMTQPNIAEGNPHFIQLNYSLHHL